VKLTTLVCLSCVTFGATLVLQKRDDALPTYGRQPFPGFVPDAETALDVARPVLKRLVGSKRFLQLRFEVRREGNTWVITGRNKEHTVSGQSGEPSFSWSPILRVNKVSGITSFEMR
jgi:hypothetical protein